MKDCLRIVVVFTLGIFLLTSCGDDKKDETQSKSKQKVEVKKQLPKLQKTEKIDSAEIKRRQEEAILQDSIQKAESELKLKAKQECATKVVFLENFYTEYFQNPESAVKQYVSDRLLSELRSAGSNSYGGRFPVWVFSTSRGGDVSWKVNIPEDENSNVFNVTMITNHATTNVYLTVVGRGGYYFIDRVRNASEGYK